MRGPATSAKLESVVERAVIVSSGPTLHLADRLLAPGDHCPPLAQGETGGRTAHRMAATNWTSALKPIDTKSWPGNVWGPAADLLLQVPVTRRDDPDIDF